MTTKSVNLRAAFQVACLGGLLVSAAGAPGQAPPLAAPTPPQMASAAASSLALPPAPSRRADPQALDLIARSDLNRGAVLGRAGVVEFDLPANGSTARVLLNPGVVGLNDLRRLRLGHPDLRWRYTVEVEALASQGQSLFKRAYHFRRDLLEASLPNGTRTTGAFYLDPSAPVPLRSDELLLSFSGPRTPQRLRLRIIEADVAFAEVLTRAYAPAPMSRRDADVQWQRLSPQQRGRLASGNLFPPQVLSQAERERLIATRWTPVPPRRGATMRELYVVRDLPDTEPVDASTPPLPGVPVAPGLVATVPLPEQTRSVRVQLTPQSAVSTDSRSAPGRVVLRWAGESVFQRSVSIHPWGSAGPLEIRVPLGAGWLEVDSDRTAAVRTWVDRADRADRADGEREITPEPTFLRLWDVTPGAPLNFDVTHASGRATPLRLVLRQLDADAARGSGAPAEVELIKADGSVLRRSAVVLKVAHSRYDQIVPPAPDLAVTEPTEVFFRVPPSVTQVRISSDGPLLAAAYTRPLNLPRQVRSPEDSLAALGEQGSVPAWFPLRPLDHEQRVNSASTRLLRVQSRPPEDRPELAAGDYTFEDFDPIRGGAARVFLAPREPGLPDRDEALASTFRALPPLGRVVLKPMPGRDTVEPRLAWAGAEGLKQFSYRISVDGHVVHTGAAGGMAGEILLPTLRPGEHTVRVEADTAVQWWLNHTAEGVPWVRRQAHELERALSFDVERQSTAREFLSVRIYAPAGAPKPLRLRVRVEAPRRQDAIGPWPGWLFTERVHEVRPTAEVALPLAESDGGYADAGRSFFIPLPEGAPRGRYRITLMAQPGAGWMTLSRVTPGWVQQRRLTLVGSLDAE